MNRQRTEDFYDYRDSLYDNIMMVTCHYSFIQMHRMYNTRSEPEGFPGGSVVRNPPTNSGNTGLIPGARGFRMPQSNWACAPQLSILCSRAQEPQLLKPVCPRFCAPQQEKSMRSSLRTATKSRPCSPN